MAVRRSLFTIRPGGAATRVRGKTRHDSRPRKTRVVAAAASRPRFNLRGRTRTAAGFVLRYAAARVRRDTSRVVAAASRPRFEPSGRADRRQIPFYDSPRRRRDSRPPRKTRVVAAVASRRRGVAASLRPPRAYADRRRIRFTIRRGAGSQRHEPRRRRGVAASLRTQRQSRPSPDPFLRFAAAAPRLASSAEDSRRRRGGVATRVPKHGAGAAPRLVVSSSTDVAGAQSTPKPRTTRGRCRVAARRAGALTARSARARSMTVRFSAALAALSGMLSDDRACRRCAVGGAGPRCIESFPAELGWRVFCLRVWASQSQLFFLTRRNSSTALPAAFLGTS